MQKKLLVLMLSSSLITVGIRASELQATVPLWTVACSDHGELIHGPRNEEPNLADAQVHFDAWVAQKLGTLSSASYPVYGIQSPLPLYTTKFTRTVLSENVVPAHVQHGSTGYFHMTQTRQVYGESQDFWNRYRDSVHKMSFIGTCGSQGIVNASRRIECNLESHGAWCGYTRNAKLVGAGGAAIAVVVAALVIAKIVHNRRSAKNSVPATAK